MPQSILDKINKSQAKAEDGEDRFIGALLSRQDAIFEIFEEFSTFTEKVFMSQEYRDVFLAVYKLADQGKEITKLTVSHLSGVSEDVLEKCIKSHQENGCEKASTYASVLYEKHLRREGSALAHKMIEEITNHEESPYDLIQRLSAHFDSLLEGGATSFEKTSEEAVLEALDEITAAVSNKLNGGQGISGLPSGLRDLDKALGGFQKTDLIVIAARPGMGKSALFAKFILDLARGGHPVGVMTLEMSAAQIKKRMLSRLSRVPATKFKDGDLTSEEIAKVNNAGKEIKKIPIFYNEKGGLSLDELVRTARKWKKKHKIELLVVDYMQLVSATNSRSFNREQEVSLISRKLKAIAKDLKIPVIALSQLSRSVETRGGSKRPMLSDLRECLTGDTRITMSDGRCLPIKDLVGTSQDVVAFNVESQKLTSQVSEVVWEVGERKVYEITLASGRKVKATGKHRFFGADGWVKVDDLSVGDRLAIARTLSEPEGVINFSDNKIILLAHLIGDGSYLSNQPLRYTTGSEANSEVVKNAAIDEFGMKVTRYDYKSTWHQLVFSGNGNRWHPAKLNLWLRELGVFNQRSHQKSVPAEIFRLSNDKIALFVRHLWATDGTIFMPKDGSRASTRISFSTSSYQLAQDLSTLLLRFGIVARIKKVPQKRHRPIFLVEVSGAEDQTVFLERIGSFGDQCRQADDFKNYLTGKVSNTNVDTLPKEVFLKVKEKMRRLNISHRKMASMRGVSYGGSAQFKFAPSRKLMLQYATLLGDSELEKLASSDIFWDVITEISEAGVEMVYDMTVDSDHSFLANGIISHNSGSIEQDSDIVMFIYRPEYYQVTEDEQGQSTKGIAELIIAKNRGGSLDTVKVGFNGEMIEFHDLNWQAQQAGYFPTAEPDARITAKGNPEEDIPF